jgi:pilus assembly protein CpaE
MYRAIVISLEATATSRLAAHLEEVGGVSVIRYLDRYPDALELTRLLRAHAPHLLFLSLASLNSAAATVRLTEEVAPGLQVIALHGTCEPYVLLEAMRMGIREFIAEPFDPNALRESLSRAADNLAKRPVGVSMTDLVFSFLPAKPGVGTTTIAVNTAIALSKVEDTRTLLMDLDLNSGLVQFMLKLENMHSVIEAADHALEMDEDLWPQLVTTIGSLDVLHAGGVNPHHRIDPVQVRTLTGFARRNYKAICADLSGNLERYAIEIMQESRIIFVVCTAELPSLHLAKQKCYFLETLDLGDRIRILLNRSPKRPVIGDADIEQLLGRQVYMKFPNDYQCVHNAMTAGSPVDPASELGRQCSALAHAVLEKTAPSEGPRRRFVEYFALAPARYNLGFHK